MGLRPSATALPMTIAVAASFDPSLAYAYGDHHSDVDLLSRAKEAFAVCPGSTLRPIAKKRGWQILDWDE